jgi:signal transduction histidine kinase
MTDKLFYTVVIISALIAIIIVFFVVSVIRYHKRYIQLQKEKIQVQIMIQEQERKRIANDLHDSLGPMLSTVKLYMHSIMVTNDRDKESLDKASNFIDDTINNLREISYNLLPHSLNRNNLAMVVNEYIARITTHHILKVQFKADDNLSLTKETELHLFRIIQEIVQNTIKHSGATKLSLIISAKPDGLFLISEDNGRGFDALSMQEGPTIGLGLKSIANRCEMIDAGYRIITAINEGCKIVIKVPI